MNNLSKKQRKNKNLNITELVEKYVIHCLEECADDNENDESKGRVRNRKTRFPNFAGFCRYYGFSRKYIENLMRKKPTQYESLCMIFEDEALNSELSPTVLTAYLKHHLGYTVKPKTEIKDGENEHITLVFEHDIKNDGK